jgi:hypothetical protein
LLTNEKKKTNRWKKIKKLQKKVMIKKTLIENFNFLKNVKVKIFENFCWKFKYLDSLEMHI